jgi:hypothetical protein
VPAFIYETGNRYGRLVVISQAESVNNRVRWLCLCDCGVTLTVTGEKLRQGKQKSCGCYRRDSASERHKIHGQSNAGGVNGKVCSGAYSSWQEMWKRCTKTDNISYKNYGGRGITVTPDWKDFETFYADMGDRPEGMSLDRVNGAEPYSKENCKWSNRMEQNQNKRNCHIITIDDAAYVLAEWCRRFNVEYNQAYRGIITKGLDPKTVLESLPKIRIDL